MTKNGDYKRQVTVKMIDIGWIHSDGLGFREFFRYLAEFRFTQKSSTLSNGINNLLAKKYTKAMYWAWVYPTLIWMIASVSFITMYAAPGIAHFSEDEKTIATILGMFTIFISSYIVLLDIIAHLPHDLNLGLLTKASDMYTGSAVILIVLDTFREGENDES